MPANAGVAVPGDAGHHQCRSERAYKTVEASINKRYGNKWSASLGGSYTIRNNFPTGSFPQTPNQPGQFERTTWNFKATGSYDAPWGVRVSPVLRHQSGANFARDISVPASAATPFGLIIPGTTVYAEPPTPTAKTTSGCSTSAPRRRST